MKRTLLTASLVLQMGACFFNEAQAAPAILHYKGHTIECPTSFKTDVYTHCHQHTTQSGPGFVFHKQEFHCPDLSLIASNHEVGDQISVHADSKTGACIYDVNMFVNGKAHAASQHFSVKPIL